MQLRQASTKPLCHLLIPVVSMTTRQELSCLCHAMQHAKNVVIMVLDLYRTHSNLVCLHIRKTDFDVRNISTDMMSSVEAANTIARKKGLSQFIIFGDDQEFMQNMSRTIVEIGKWEKDAVLVSKFEDYIDLYISSKLCDAFLITAVTSTFGWWLAFFAPGQDAIYYMPDTRIHGDKRPSKDLFL
ncbi:hypothetical protein ANCCAN_23955 [Ancylostoma caninum]|uniref:Uncharacterized protein n=1 Tax=Ancylostoma caninum TaxID=29170 RepID=A0A368FHI5_ANCCA|nr:hypothetical protein ANCCAN_23955 [Ancylostoma caninum]